MSKTHNLHIIIVPTENISIGTLFKSLLQTQADVGMGVDLNPKISFVGEKGTYTAPDEDVAPLYDLVRKTIQVAVDAGQDLKSSKMDGDASKAVEEIIMQADIKPLMPLKLVIDSLMMCQLAYIMRAAEAQEQAEKDAAIDALMSLPNDKLPQA